MPPTLLTALVFFFLSSVNSHSCLSHNHHQCPPFSSSTPPPFPFSFSPGCGHPSFQLNCSKTTTNNTRSLISINNLTFSLLHFDPNSSSLLLKPITTSSNCSLFSIPNRPINLSATPFRFSDASCHRLSVLRPCSRPPNLSSCPNHCHWQCKLTQNPVKLFHGCGSRRTSSLPDQGCQGDVLAYLDSFLQLGIELEWDEDDEEDDDSYFTSCRDCKARKNGVCGYNVSDPTKHFLCYHHTEARISPPWISKQNTAVLCTVLAMTCLMVGVSVLLARSRRLSSSSNEQEEEDPTVLFLHRHRAAALLPPLFTYDELEASTNKFDTKRKIGDGGFGSVYLGQLRDGRVVAVKYLHRGPTTHSTKAFCNEILILSSIDHANLVKLHGYCSDPRGLLLVYDYVTNGTLADHLHHHREIRGSRLTWQVRVDVALQIATVMEYLHFNVVPPVVHRDITSSNIFVEKDMKVKVGDFGLSRMLVFPETTSFDGSDRSGYVWTGPQGTPGYLDPDYYKSFRLTEKSDVYSFGVVMLELISGLKAVDGGREKTELTLADMMVSKIQMGLLNEVVDPILVNEEGVDVAAELAFRCVAAEKDDRPDASEVVEELRRIRSRTRGGSSNVNGALTSTKGELPMPRAQVVEF